MGKDEPLPVDNSLGEIVLVRTILSSTTSPGAWQLGWSFADEEVAAASSLRGLTAW